MVLDGPVIDLQLCFCVWAMLTVLLTTVCTYVLITFCITASPSTAPNVTGMTSLSSTSFTVSWTITDPDHNYVVTWTNLHTGMMSSVTVPENTNSYMVTGLNGVDNYNVSVTANSSCGMMMSDPATVYGNAYKYLHMYVTIYMLALL